MYTRLLPTLSLWMESVLLTIFSQTIFIDNKESSFDIILKPFIQLKIHSQTHWGHEEERLQAEERRRYLKPTRCTTQTIHSILQPPIHLQFIHRYIEIEKVRTMNQLRGHQSQPQHALDSVTTHSPLSSFTDILRPEEKEAKSSKEKEPTLLPHSTCCILSDL